jgi:RNA polymerase sigma factor (sigma-70 family)
MTRIFTLSRHRRPEDDLQACRGGDQAAMRRVFDQLAPKMLGVCRRYLQRLDLAEEAMSSGFARAFRHLDTLRDNDRFEYWLKSIMVRECIDTLRREKRYRFEEELEPLLMDNGQADVHSLLQAEDLLKLIDAMPHGYRTVFNLFAIEGYSHQEIAGMLGISESTSKTQYKKAREALRLKMNGASLKKTTHGSL